MEDAVVRTLGECGGLPFDTAFRSAWHEHGAVTRIDLASDGERCSIRSGDDVVGATRAFARAVAARRESALGEEERARRADEVREAVRSLRRAMGRLPSLPVDTHPRLRAEDERVRRACAEALRERVVERPVCAPGDAALYLPLRPGGDAAELERALRENGDAFAGLRVVDMGSYRFAVAHFLDVAQPEELLRDASVLSTWVREVRRTRDGPWRPRRWTVERSTVCDGDDVGAMRRCTRMVEELERRLRAHKRPAL